MQNQLDMQDPIFFYQLMLIYLQNVGQQNYQINSAGIYP